MHLIKKDKFSEFADLGDLSKYNLSQISSLIKYMKRVEKIEGQINLVKWSDETYSLEIEYDLHGNFRKICSEHFFETKYSFISKFFNSIKKTK